MGSVICDSPPLRGGGVACSALVPLLAPPTTPPPAGEGGIQVEQAATYSSIATITTDLAGSSSVTAPPAARAVIGCGTTVFGASKVFTELTAGAVSTVPEPALARTPGISARICAGRLGSRLTSDSQSLPPVSRAATASTRGNTMSPRRYSPASNVTGTSVASWKG